MDFLDQVVFMGMSMGYYLDYTNRGGKTHPLWVATIPRQEILNYIIIKNTSMHTFILSTLDNGYD